MNELTWAPCPFCGGTQFDVTSKENYYDLLEEHGTACICFHHRNRARGCCLDLYEHSDSIRGYNAKLKKLNDKWNRRYEKAD